MAGGPHWTGEEGAAGSASVADLRQQLQNQRPLPGALQQLLAALGQGLREGETGTASGGGRWGFTLQEPWGETRGVGAHLQLAHGDCQGFLQISLQVAQLLPLTLQEVVGAVFVLQQIKSGEFQVEAAAQTAHTLRETELKGLRGLFSQLLLIVAVETSIDIMCDVTVDTGGTIRPVLFKPVGLM